MKRREVYQAAVGHHQCGDTGSALFSMLILIDQDLVRIARALEARNDLASNLAEHNGVPMS